MTNNYLEHHGILGQKWGVRRFQNKNGTLTAQGRKRYLGGFDNDDSAIGDSQKRKQSSAVENGESSKPKEKSYKDMTDDELRAGKARYELEANYLAAKKKVEPEQEQEVGEKRESFMKKFFNEAVKPALIDVGKKQIKNYLNTFADEELKKFVNKNTNEDSLKYLQNEANKWEAKRKIAEEQQKVNKYEKIKQQEEEQAAKKQAAKKQAAKEQRKAERASQKEQRSKKKMNKNSTSGDDNVEYFKAKAKDVFGKGTSKFKGWNDPPTQEAVWNGQRYVNELLQSEDKS